MNRIAFGTLAFVACAVVVQITPSLATWLSFERAAIGRAELWRLFTGHLVHDTPRLAQLDLAAFVIFGTWIELTSRRLFAALLVTSALGSALAVFFLTDYERYVGSSALTSGLVVAAGILSLHSSRSRTPRIIGLALLALFATKLALESFGAWPAALGGLPPGYEPVAAAHFGGALAGAAVLYGWWLQTRDLDP